MPTASLVIPSRGGAARLPLLLAALADQTSTDWEAIVVLDGDIDDSERVLHSLSTELPVRIITFPENRGRVAALNAGFAAARGDVLIRCDDDLRPRADYVANHVASHQGSPQGTVGLYRNVYPSTPYAEIYGQLMDTQFRREAYACAPDRRWRYWAGNVSVPRETWERVGPYDVRYRAYGWEDVDWGFRVHQVGLPVNLDTSLETDHHVAATTTQVRAVRAFHSGAARHTFEGIHGQEALPHAPASMRLSWDGLVHTLALRLTAERVARMSATIDRRLGSVPAWMGRKMIALIVEASAEAGYLNPVGTSNEI